MDSTIIAAVSIVLVFIGTVPLLFYLRKRTIKRYIAYLEEVKSIINGRWIKMGMVINGEYKGRKVRCGITERGENALTFLRVKPHKELPQKRIFLLWDYPHPTSDTTLRDGWIETRYYLPFLKEFFEKSSFINKLEKFTQICEKIEKGEIRL